MCSKCSCIHDDNRDSQEEFKCVHCGYEDNADINAANNIRNKVILTMLKDLLKQDAQLKTFTPKNISRQKLKKFLTEAFSDSQSDLQWLIDVVEVI
jgi:hypothetical protein